MKHLDDILFSTFMLILFWGVALLYMDSYLADGFVSAKGITFTDPAASAIVGGFTLIAICMTFLWAKQMREIRNRK